MSPTVPDLRDDKVVVVFGAKDLDATLDFIRDADDLNVLPKYSPRRSLSMTLCDAPGGDVVGLRALTFGCVRSAPSPNPCPSPPTFSVFRDSGSGSTLLWIEFLDGHAVTTSLKKLAKEALTMPLPRLLLTPPVTKM